MASMALVLNHNEHADMFGFTLTMNEFADMVKHYTGRSNHDKVPDGS